MALQTEEVSVSFLRFEGGKNTRFSPLTLEDNEVVEVENFFLEGRGGLEKRGGYEYLFTDDVDTGFPINGLFYFKPVDSVVRVENGAISYNDGAGWTDITDTLTISDDPDDLWNFTVFKKTLVGTNGVDTPLKWTGTGDAATITTAIGSDDLVTAGFVIRHRERLIFGDVTTDTGGGTRYESRLWPTAVGSVDTLHANLTDGKIIDISEGDGDNLTAAVEAMGYLVVFKQNSLYRINNFGEAGVQQVVRIGNVGCPGMHCVKVIGNIVIFRDIIGQTWAYDAKGSNEDSLVNLSERKLGKQTLDLINKTRLPLGHMWVDRARNEIRSWHTGAGFSETNETQTFNLTTGGFADLAYTDPMNISADYVDASNEVRCIVGTYDGGVMLLDEGLQDNGVTYPCSVLLRQLDFGDHGVIKGTRMTHIYGQVENEQTITFEHMVNFAPVGTAFNVVMDGPGVGLDEFVLDEDILGSSGESIAKVRAERYARWHQFRISQNTDEALRLVGVVTYLVVSGTERDGT